MDGELNRKHKYNGVRLAAGIVAAFFTALTFCVDRSSGANGLLAVLDAMRGDSVFIFAVFVAFAAIYYKTLFLQDKRKMVYALIGAAIFSLLESIGYCFNQHNAFSGETMSKSTIAVHIGVALGIFFLFYAILTALFHALEKKDFIAPKSRRHCKFFTANVRSLVIVAAVLFLSWLPYYLAYFPGIISPDSHMQIGQAIGAFSLYNHHPVAHTQLMGLFIHLGKAVWGTIAGGVAVFALVQMLSLAFLFSFIIFYMAKYNLHPGLRIMTLLFYGLHPVNAMYSITLWKDIWSSAFILLYVVILVEICNNRENFFASKWRLACFALVVLGMFFFKHIGLYVFLFSLPFLFLAARKYVKRLLALALVCIVFYAVVNGPVFSALNIEKGSVREMLSIPLQQIARTVKEYGKDLTGKEKETIGSILPYDDLPELYNPRLSDPVKDKLNTATFEADQWRYIKLWVNLFFKYPDAYIESLLSGSFGYWYPDVKYVIVAQDNYIEYELYSAKMYPNEIWDKDLYAYEQPDMIPALKQIMGMLNNKMQNIPVLSMFFSIGFVNWVMLVCVLICLVQKRRRMLLPFTVMFGVFLTCIASPVFAEFRYAYSEVVCLPLLIGVALTKNFNCTKAYV